MSPPLYLTPTPLTSKATRCRIPSVIQGSPVAEPSCITITIGWGGEGGGGGGGGHKVRFGWGYLRVKSTLSPAYHHRQLLRFLHHAK